MTVNTQNNTKTVASKETNNTISAWLGFVSEPKNRENLNNLAERIDAECRRRLPEGLLSGILAGHEDEIRQDASLMLMQRFLTGNKNLMAATASGNLGEAESQLLRSLVTALSYSRKRLRKKLEVEMARSIELDENNAGSCCHDSDRGLFELPYPVKRDMAMACLRGAVSLRLLSASNARIAGLAIEQGMSVTQIADTLKITRGAVYQQIDRVRQHLPGLLANMEVPVL